MNNRNWLIIFNVVTLLAWVAFIVITAMHGLQFNSLTATALAIAQGLAVFEILNAMLGIAGSAWMLTTLQVSSRLFIATLLLMMVSGCPCPEQVYWGFKLITVAWGLTEVVRAAHYLGDLLNRQWKSVTWLRYSLFIVLYPMGVTGEFLILYGYWKIRGGEFDLIGFFLALIVIVYLIFFPKLYGHMLKQRRRKLN